MSTFRFPVQGAHVLMFARTIGERDPAFDDVARLLATGPDALVAPPTFLMAADHFDPDFERRPRSDRPWIGHAGDRPRSPGFHLEQEFTFARPVRIGDVLTVRSRAGESWQRASRRAGTMSFTEQLTEFCDPDGSPVAAARWVSATTEHAPTAPPAPSTPPAEQVDHTTEQAAHQPAHQPAADLDALTVGAQWTTTLVTDLSPAQIATYAGASGDFHPTHVDHGYAAAQGYPGVFAHGMLTMGLSGRPVTEAFGHASVRSFGGRMRAQVWPGSTLSAAVRVTDASSQAGQRSFALSIHTTDQHGAVVFDGTARVTGSDDQMRERWAARRTLEEQVGEH